MPMEQSHWISGENGLYLLSCGYIRPYFGAKNRNPKDIGYIITKLLYEDWKFDYFETSCYSGHGDTHGIYNDSKTAKCDCLDTDHSCYSFYRVSCGMNPNSGIYDIKMRIDDIKNGKRWSAIGITCNTDKQVDSYNSDYWGYLNDHIGWSSFDHSREFYSSTFRHMQNGLLCCAPFGKENENIFVKNKFVYTSQNQFYKKQLPHIKTGDTIIMRYDSNNHILSFYKSNDLKLNAQISNLPKDKTFYWFAGRFCGEFSVTIE